MTLTFGAFSLNWTNRVYNLASDVGIELSRRDHFFPSDNAARSQRTVIVDDLSIEILAGSL